MCIRAIDYCPPVGITFGQFLRAVVTADLELFPEERYGFRLVFAESFREWGIHPRGLNSLGLDLLAWPTGAGVARELIAQGALSDDDEADVRRSRHLAALLERITQGWDLECDRFKTWHLLSRDREQAWHWLQEDSQESREYARIFGLVTDDEGSPRTVYRDENGKPTLEVHSLRPALRRTVYGSSRTDLVLLITQRRRGYFDRDEQTKEDGKKEGSSGRRDCDFWYRAGCTVLIDPVTAEVRRIIRTPGTIADDSELERVRSFLTGESSTIGNAFDAGLTRSLRIRSRDERSEPFALLHQLEEA